MKNLLLSASLRGGLWLILLFLFCFFGVHLIKLARLGWSQTKAPPSEPKPESKEKQAPAKQEPVYYIVERKKRAPKSSYGPPQPFSFKNEK